jgi:hypothetical protein
MFFKHVRDLAFVLSRQNEQLFKSDQAVDKSWVALFLSTALSRVAFHLSITH